MILKIHAVYNAGDKAAQHVLLTVTGKGNLGDYAIVDNTFNQDGEPSNLSRHFYSFPNHPIDKDQTVVLYTSKGENMFDAKHKATNRIVHFLYWNLDISVWNKGDTAHLLQLVDSTSKHLPEN